METSQVATAQTTAVPSLSLIFLAYNEEATLDAVIGDAAAYCQQRLDDWEILIVDDGSQDDTASIARGWAERDERIRLLQHGQNRGMGAGMATGIRAARCEYLVFLSADGQAPVAELDKLFPLLEDADIALSVYPGRERESWRRVLSRGLRAYMTVVAGIRFQLEGLYLFPVKLAKALVDGNEANTFFFSFELIDRAVRLGLRTATTEMEYHPRAHGRSKVTSLRRIARVAGEVTSYALRRRRRQAPG